MNKPKPKPKRKRKAAVAKHIVVHAPLKLHIHPEIVPANRIEVANAANVYVPANTPQRSDHESLAEKIRQPAITIPIVDKPAEPRKWWEFWK